MRIVNHRQFVQPAEPAPQKRWRRYALYGFGGLLLAVLLINIGMLLAYRQRVLPGYSLGGVAVGNVAFNKLDERLTRNGLPQQVTLYKGSVSKALSTASLGAHVDIPGSLEDIKKARPPLPIVALFTRHAVPVRVTVNSTTMQKVLPELAAIFKKDALIKRIAFNGSAFVVAPAEPGYQLAGGSLARDLAAALQQGKASMEVSVTALDPPQASTDLNAEIAKLQKKLAIKTTFTYTGKTIQPAARDIGGWYATDFNVMKLSATNIGAYLDSVAPAAANRNDLILALQYAFSKEQPLNLAIAPAGSVTHTYCTATRGVSEAALDDMIGKLAATYADTRGWNAGGKMAFAHVVSGCEYTVWLSAAGQMTSFGSICDDYYNCQVGSSVVVNNDRWTQATPPWNATGASLEDYRALIIDHETGHRLGFYDNPTCPAAGGPAPVMMQQSIDLQGCTFNRWPTAVELAAVLGKNGL